MELFTIIVAIPLIMIISILYSNLIDKILLKFNYLYRLVVFISIIILVLFITELLLLYFWGALELQQISKNLYYNAHMVLFFLLLPSLINIIKTKISRLDKWYNISIISVIFSIFILLIQVYISETIFGIE